MVSNCASGERIPETFLLLYLTSVASPKEENLENGVIRCGIEQPLLSAILYINQLLTLSVIVF